MPETAVNKHGHLSNSEDEVWPQLTWPDGNLPVTSPPSDVPLPQGLGQDHFGTLVARGADCGHHLGAFFVVKTSTIESPAERNYGVSKCLMILRNSARNAAELRSKNAARSYPITSFAKAKVLA